MAEVKKEVLFISWCPLDLLRPRAIQVGRVGKAVRQHGWQASLICAALDAEIEQDLFDEELGNIYRPQFKRIISVPDLAYFSPPPPTNRSKGLAARVVSVLGLRDETGPWAELATRTANRQIKRHRQPIVVSFAQPWSSHRVGRDVKRLNPRARWIAHFSDPWVDNPYLNSQHFDLEAAKREEKDTIRDADAVVFVTHEAADLVMRKYPPEWRRKAAVIPHMLDSDIISMLPRQLPDARKRLRLTHAGSLYGGKRAPTGLFSALRDLRGSGFLDNEIEVQLVGETPPSVRRMIENFQLWDVCSSTTPLYYLSSLRAMSHSDVLLVIDADLEESPFLPSKAVDYLMFGKPIAGLTPKGSATSRFLADIGYSSVNPTDAEGIKKLITALMHDWRGGRLRPTEAHVRVRPDYDTFAIGARYAELFETV